MPKRKTKSSVAKRFKITKNGKVKMTKAFRRHILTSKPSGRKRALAQPGILSDSDAPRIRVMLPYGSN